MKTIHALSLLLLAAVARAQEAGAVRLDLERLYSGELRTEGFGPVRWLEDGRGYTSLERARGGGHDIVLHDPGTGKTRVLVAAGRLKPEGAERPLGVADYAWSAKADKLLVFTNTRRVWRYNTRGDYWVLDLSSGALKQLGAGLDASRLQFAKFSPDGTRVGYVYRNDIYVEGLANGKITKLTEGGSPTLSNGTFDWVYEEEWGLRDGFRWSPDGKRIAYWQIDASGVREFTLIDYTAGLYPKLTSFPYPKVGEQNPACRVGVVDATGGATTWLELPGDLRNDYVARMEWAASSDEVIVQRVNRLQNTIRVMLGVASTGKARDVYVDRDDAWAEVCDDLVWFDGGKRFTWVSERDGWRHVYLVPRDGGEPKLVTPGAYDVVSIVQIDEKGGWIYFIASPENPTQRFLYRVSLAAGKTPERLTPKGAGGTHAYQMSQDSKWAIHTSSAFDSPQRIALVSLPDHKTVRALVDNEGMREKLASLAPVAHEFFRVEIGDGVEVDGWSLKPPGFDPQKKYPLLIYVYGEPAGQTVRDRWGGGNHLWHLMLAQQGFVVVSFDNRGTPAPRGRAWRKSIYRQIGILAAKDQAAALRALLKKWSFIDPERVGIWGWSGGGSMSLNAIFRYPDLYSTAVAIAFIADQRYYDTIYQERYMGLPAENRSGFKKGSPITWAQRLKGNLLLVYGTGDDNCHYQNCEALVNELVRHGKQFQLMTYPNRSHGIHEGRGTRKHLFTLITNYLTRHLQPRR